MVKKIVWEWEKIDDNTLRVKVIGGWLVRCIGGMLKAEVITVKEAKNLAMCESMTFIADRDHEWIIIPPFKENPDDIQKDKSADFEPK